MKVYLAGPINGCSDSECKDWREKAKGLLDALRIDVLDPMIRDYRGVENQSAAAIVEGDKQDIAACDVLLVYFVKPSVGTSMEVFFAHGLGKPVVIVHPDTHAEKLSPWLVYHSTATFQSLEEAATLISQSRWPSLSSRRGVG